MVVGSLTLPAFSMLAMLLSSVKVSQILLLTSHAPYHDTSSSTVKVLGMLQRIWPFHWLATLLALVTSAVVAPVARLCELVLRASLSALHLLPSPPLLKGARHTA